ncbi:hypothetical protein [Paraflavitalea speifideaquila]|uniref:hypothetical protein n=1 Tax=Paraflavitalea speifideaquila TaxID=3076558 RepID=UPI0028EB9848|nr:hypothetical protein [Paraflavitalea speifideiaquila]
MEQTGNDISLSGSQDIRFNRFPAEGLTETLIAQHSRGAGYVEAREYRLITPHSLNIDNGIFIGPYAIPPFPPYQS